MFVTDICLTGKEALARIPLDKYFPKRSYGLVLRRGKFLSPQAKRFIEMMDPQFFRQERPTGKKTGNGAPAKDAIGS